ncbi:MAG TPA: DUF1345 domain-containing protein [Candidatus Cybelea sp.]|nr:DUF1345 domain-containing protein [Candidatus Cybelea sp.]
MKSRALKPILLSFGIAGIAAFAIIFAPPWLRPMERVIACYDAGALALLGWHWALIWRTNADATKRRAAAEDPGRDAVFVLILIAVGFGFVAAFAILGRGPIDRVAQHVALLYVLGFGTVVLGWLQIHTEFCLRYAHLYYRDSDRDKESDRGLTFPGGEEPSYIDFAYFSFVVGMTFQVSDVQVTARIIRRAVLGHGLVSFAYNTAILALVVNIVSGLLH